MKQFKFYLLLSLQIIIIFSVALFASFVPEQFHSFFGDAYCQGNLNTDFCSEGWSKFSDSHGPEWHFGYRHIIWLFMGISLFVIQAIRIMKFIYDNNK